ncbi:hypothetical protein CDD81_751 [Ophiocordyceps australis]|uniref:Pentacotripeptide-repeat region of PRORP domain-containing protein n=1 Tax=Ophiocordyceps australis TaxID=1399860 RepID=A0A2C5Y2D7_9HYPO|nr:hypothetical protein CDD81_751 [Ophiocordyceps australis]
MNASRASCLRLAAARVRCPGACARLSSASDATRLAESSTSSLHSHAAAIDFFHEIVDRRNGSVPQGQPQGHDFLSRSPAVAAASSAVGKAEAILIKLISMVPRATQQRSQAATETRTADGSRLAVQASMPVIADGLSVFEKEVQPLLRKARPGDHRHLYTLARRYLNSVRKYVLDAGVMGYSIWLSKLCNSIGDWRLDIRNELVLNLCHNIITSKHSTEQSEQRVKELVDMWKHISQCRRPSQIRQPELQFTLPSAKYIISDADNKSGIQAFNIALASIFNQHSVDEARSLVPGLLVTLAVWADARFTSLPLQAETATLLNMVAGALPHDVGRRDYLEILLEQPRGFCASRRRELHEYTEAHWPAAVQMLCIPHSTWRVALSRQTNSRRQSSNLAVFHKQLRAAYKSGSKGAAVSIWNEVKVRLKAQPDLLDQLAGLPDFVDFWIFVWCAMRLPAMLQETVDVMRQAKMQPTIRSYTAMMHGWKVCKDFARISGLWTQLVDSNVRLDAAIWTERISSYIAMGQPQEALQALGEMQARWKKAVEANVENTHATVKPNIEVVNAAFMGLLRIDYEAAHKVLAWGVREGIEPNVRTYNALLREAFRNQDAAEAVQNIFCAMQQGNISPDGATFTICLEEILGTLHNRPRAEQVEAVQQVLNDMKKAGLRANGETYAKMLYAVASLPGGGADDAVAAVQKHMQDSGMETTPHMVTILLERAMARNPPGDFEMLLQRHGLNNVAKGDQTLWERVMSARANSSRHEAAMALFNELAYAGRPATSLACLVDLLAALLDAQRVEDARRVVTVVTTHKLAKLADDDVWGGTRYWRHHFWHLARRNGLLPWDKLPRELQNYFASLEEL